MFSVWGDTLNWAKKFTPRIPLGNNSRLFILGPWTALGAIVGLIAGLKNKFSHPKVGSVEKDHSNTNVIHNANMTQQKAFSDRGISKLDFKQLCEEVPGYDKIALLCNMNWDLLDKLSNDNKMFIWKNFPSFLIVAKPDQIYAYRQDFISKSNEDYSEILFTFGNELVYLWDFDKKYWSVQDRTYSPKKEWRIEGDILDGIKHTFDPKNNQLLQKRIEAFESDPELANSFNIRKYCETILKLIDLAKKY